jgi:hypothetical protein
MYVRGIMTAVALVAATSTATAGDAIVGGVSVKLPPPSGFCDLTEREPSDKRMLTIIGGLVAKSGNKLHVMSADCKQLSEWRTGKRSLLDDFAQYQTPMSDKPPAETIAQTCATLRAQGAELAAKQAPDIKANVERALKNVKINETRFIGVLAESTVACYGGLLQKLKTEAGTEKVQLNVFAATIVKNRSHFIYRIALYTNASSVDTALKGLRSTVAAFLAANRD